MFDPNTNLGNGHFYQQDAEEFFSYFLEKMHEDLLQEMSKHTILPSEKTHGNDEGWEEVSKENKTNKLVTVFVFSFCFFVRFLLYFLIFTFFLMFLFFFNFDLNLLHLD